MKTETLRARSGAERRDAVAQAVRFLSDGEVVALPTETVYGLAADAFNVKAVLKIFSAKERPSFDPLIVHLPDSSWLDRIAQVGAHANAMVENLIAEFWPGPLTIVLPRRAIVPDVVTAGLETVAVRVSRHPVFSEVIREFGGPLAAPSANQFGRISPTAAEHVRDELDGRIPLIVDGGATKHGIESTIITIRDRRMELLRTGPITVEQLRKFGEVTAAEVRSRPEAPGQLPSHYAPRTPLVLVREAGAFVRRANARCGLLAWSRTDASGFCEIRQLSVRGDFAEAAANLFRFLRELDAADLDLIVAEALPEEGLGKAIMERLRRAAAPR